MTQQQFYRSREWEWARRDYIAKRLAIDGGLCEVCGVRLGKIVHHKIWLDDINCNDPDISLNPDNFRYECRLCHNREENPRKLRGRRFRFDADGNVLEIK